MRCDRCGLDLHESEIYNLHGKHMCEDCYMYETNLPKACDPLAVESATSIRRELGQSGTVGLSEMQRKICDIVEHWRQITREEMLKMLAIKPEELESQPCHIASL
jgi:hypothetical protein